MTPASATEAAPVVSVRDLRVRFATREGTVHAVNGELRLTIPPLAAIFLVPES